ncbi:hypothetical protein [Polyangium sp. 6x1]|uniref:hypothetical protein n=1 Tax=Polyangium sp. 6x1 TaxID=3042689 RepID=UPI002482E159|nr:hypothetical protein [Polyangium sp. 6x1]MDI1444649.1 hypothetical protein [Polyangium sp. 6x1]
MKPFYEGQGVRIWHAAFEAVLAAGVIDVQRLALVHADPSYGVRERVRRRSNRRGLVPSKTPRVAGYAQAHDWPEIEGDDRPCDPSAVLALGRPTVLWGAQNYASRLPDSSAWWCWDKRDGTTSDDNGDVELAWTNIGRRTRRFGHAWRGLARASETGRPHLHPTQKPVALSTWVFEQAGLKRGDRVFVPYMGSGPDIAAALGRGLYVDACDVAEWCCRVAVAERIAGPLFATSGA